ncbi:Ankyrin repeat domain-containing protein 50 [Armadillidium nasatum]|uniref:Ankyrin repeat domain-containing protein 50 n=1 Tax=Armadillidium nasatum TaxID=96803 RepID=A0A5N5T3V8_9CRUS|nr:Ankyrin repeat domain-containing protein 50 [Armadillidium nasatum]
MEEPIAGDPVLGDLMPSAIDISSCDSTISGNYANIEALLSATSAPPPGFESSPYISSEAVTVDSPSSYYTADNLPASHEGDISLVTKDHNSSENVTANEDPTTTTSSDPTVAEDATIEADLTGTATITDTDDFSTLNQTKDFMNLEDDIKDKIDKKSEGLSEVHSASSRESIKRPSKTALCHERRFFCREWAWAKLWACVEQRPSAKTCGVLIVGGPGTGKTALCSQLVNPTGAHGRHATLLQNRILAHHFCHAHDAASLSVAAFIQSLVVQLAQSKQLVGYGAKVTVPEVVQALDPIVLQKDPDEAFRRAILFPLLEVEAPENTQLLLVDSIDEDSLLTYGGVSAAQRNEGNSTKEELISKSILELLSNHHHLLPQWLLLVVTARRGAHSRGLTRTFSGFRKIALDDLRRSHVVRDVQQYILCRLDTEPALRYHLSRETAEMLNQLHIKSNGCFLYLEKVLDGVVEGWVTLREIRDIPGTLNGLYLWLCQRLYPRKNFHRVLPLLSVILASRAPLTQQEVQEAVTTHIPGLSEEEWGKRWALLRRVLCPYTPHYLLLFHHSFAEWLLDVKHCTQKYLVGVSEGHAMLAMKYTLKASLLSPLEIQAFAFHLARISVKAPLEPFHLPLWLICSGAPVADCFEQIGLPARTPSYGESEEREMLITRDGTSRSSKSGSRRSGKRRRRKHREDPLYPYLRGGPINGVDAAGRTLLHNAAHQGDASLVAVLLERGAIHSLTDKGGQTPLNLAARHGHADVVTTLLAFGANPDHADDDGWTSLRSAAWAGHVGVVEALLKGGAEADLADGDGRTALRAAAWGGHEDVVATLLNKGADVNRADSEGRTPLIAAAYMGHYEIVTALIEGGADVNHADKDGRSALSVGALCVTSLVGDFCAPAAGGRLQVVTALLEGGADVDHEDKDGLTPLLVAAFEGHVDVCELLLEYDADVDHVDRSGRTPLLAAASMGHASVVERLLFWGCYVDHIDVEGRTVLSVAAAQGSQDTVRLLLDRGLDETHRDNAGWTPLHYAAFEGHKGVCEALIEGGARINEVDNDGKHALVLAGQEGHADVVATLLDSGAALHHTSHDGRSALRVAALEGHKDVVRLLLNRGADLHYKDADGRSTLYLLALEDRLEMAAFLLDHGADVESKDLEGRTPLHVTAWQGHIRMVGLLLSRGARVDAEDHERRTPLQSAAWQGNADIVRILLEHGAHADHCCSQGATALSIAAQEGHEECVALLLQFGANPGHSDRCGRTAIKVALKGGHLRLARILEEHLEQQKIHGAGHGIKGEETKPCSSILCPGLTASPGESPESTFEKRRSCMSLGAHSSSKSSCNLSTSTRSSGGGALPTTSTRAISAGDPSNVSAFHNHHFAPHNYQQQQQFGPHPAASLSGAPPPIPPAPLAPPSSVSPALSFTQQLQQCGRVRGRKNPTLPQPPLTPLDDPASPIYASPPISPVNDVPPPLPQRMNPLVALLEEEYALPCHKGKHHHRRGVSSGRPEANCHLEQSRKAVVVSSSSHVASHYPYSSQFSVGTTGGLPPQLQQQPLPPTPYQQQQQQQQNNNQSVGAEGGSTSGFTFTQDSHMRIILGSRSPEARPKRNGIVTNPSLKAAQAKAAHILRNGLPARPRQYPLRPNERNLTYSYQEQ